MMMVVGEGNTRLDNPFNESRALEEKIGGGRGGGVGLG